MARVEHQACNTILQRRVYGLGVLVGDLGALDASHAGGQNIMGRSLGTSFPLFKDLDPLQQRLQGPTQAQCASYPGKGKPASAWQ